MTQAWVFPGQGSQAVGMGKALYDTFTEAKEVFQEVDDVLSQELSTLIFEGPMEELTLTANTQPALMAVSLAVARVLEKQSGKTLAEMASYVAGHSLGEYAALAAAGSFSLADTARLLRIRGEAMQAAVPAGQGGMGALIGADLAQAEAIAQEAAQGDVLQVANDNSPGQIVLSGAKAAVERVAEIAATHGIKRFVPLPVSAPFHSALMQPAAERMREALAEVQVQAPSVPLIANVTTAETTDPDTIRVQLVEQVTGRVRWRESLLVLAEKGVAHTVELGAGKVLAGLTKRTVKDMEATSIGTPEEVEAYLKQWA
ncbi:MAG: ACP S-malonyltransferase [Hyphomicrobiales bacterium]|nr:ACP S-malonyltransferase [Rickettsiales bacterium]MCP5361231.1 ACP S-malonyltransferase [Hyphomicrobiales bacterium]